MATVTLTPALRTEYESLFNSCAINPRHMATVDQIVARLLANRMRYQRVRDGLGIPWAFVAVTHNMESSLDFSRHLHNGDPLTSRTVQVPAGRPKTGAPPLTWEESATDALTMKKLGARTDWCLAGMLYQLERYNGWGYRLYHRHVMSPYLWCFSTHYTSGKYVADGTWSDTAASRQCGAAVLLRRMAEKGYTEFADQPAPQPGVKALVPVYSRKKSPDPLIVARVEDLQRWLNTYPGIFLKVDGAPGNLTSDAYKKLLAVICRVIPAAGYEIVNPIEDARLVFTLAACAAALTEDPLQQLLLSLNGLAETMENLEDFRTGGLVALFTGVSHQSGDRAKALIASCSASDIPAR